MKKLLFIICILTAGFLKAQIITTVVGNGSGGYSGDGGQATAAQLDYPWSATMDAAGNIYTTQAYANVIRKISLGGIITTVAGNGIAGYSGDGGQATNASMGNSLGVAVDAAGNLFFSDSNNVIRKVNAVGIITTVVGTGVAGYTGDGGQATAATLYDPNGMAFDAQGNLYVCDGGNNVIRMINTAGIITTVAGNGFGGYGGDGGQATATELNGPTNVTFDASGNLYIADQSNQRIRMVNRATGIITSVAGSGPTGPWHGSFSGDGGQATAATLDLPTDIKFDTQGNLYIVDLYSNHIRKVNTAGIITTVVGNGGFGFSGDGGIATAASLAYPGSIFFDSSDNLYVTDQDNYRIRKVGTSASVPPSANFHVDHRDVCSGSTVTFSDSTTNAVVTSYQWSFPGGSLVSGYILTDSTPKVIYNTPGMYAVSYTATNAAGQTSITKTSYINVVINIATYHAAFSEGFEIASIPGTDWSVSNNASSNWALTNAAAASGAKSVTIDNFTNTTNNVSELVSPTFNLAAINSPVLSFDLAYQQKATTNNDKMQVYVSTDCGGGWASKWARNGSGLQPISVSGQSSTPFTPNPSQFTTYTVNISSLASNTNVMFKWVFTAGASSVGNNIYMDNINVYDATTVGIKDIETEIGLNIYPNPSSNNVHVVFNLTEKNRVTINVVDMIGRVVETLPTQFYPTGESMITLGNKVYEPGVYFININIDEQQISRKIVIQ